MQCSILHVLKYHTKQLVLLILAIIKTIKLAKLKQSMFDNNSKCTVQSQCVDKVFISLDKYLHL